MRWQSLPSIFAVILSITATCLPAAADTSATDLAALTKPGLAVGMAACLLSSDTEGSDRAARAGDAVLLSVAVARMVKDSTDSGFPSGHTAAAFAMASSLSEIHPKQKWIYYAAAGAIAYSTVASDGHSVTEALGGAALGIAIGHASMSSKDGLFLSKTFKF